MTARSRLLSDTDLPAPVEDRYFEDYLPGSTYEFGTLGVTADEIVEFAEQWDPQTIHTDPAWAVTGPFGGLIASGLHTMALCMRLYVEHYISAVASLASPGLGDVGWPAPVRPGDELRIRVSVAAARASRTRPDRGLVTTEVEGLNQHGATVLTFTAVNFFALRHPG